MSRRTTNDYNKLRQLADQGDANACFDIAESYYAQKNYSEAFKWYKKTISCKNPNPVAYFNIAYALQFGEGVDVDIASSLDYYQKAVTYELPQAMYNLAFFYQNGIIVPKDSEKAVRLCREATLKLNELLNKLFKLQSEQETLAEEYYASIKLINDANERVKLLENKNSNSEATNKALDKENRRLTDEVIKYKNQFQNADSQKSHLLDENQKLEKRLNHSEQTITDKDRIINSLNEQIIDLQKNSEALSAKYFELVRSVEKLQGENEALSTSLKKSEEEYKNILVRNSQLVDQLNTKEQDFSSLMQRYVTVSENSHNLNTKLNLEENAKRDAEAKALRLSNEKSALERTMAQKNNDYYLKEESLNEIINRLRRLKTKLFIVIGALGGGLLVSLIILVISFFDF